MALLIEEIKKVSALAAFLFDSLASIRYPNCLFWVNIEEVRVCLNCVRKNMKGYIEEEEKLFKDYAAFTGKSSTTYPRSLLLSAMSHSPYVKIDKENSTHDVKYFRFTEKFNDLLDSYFHGTNGESYLQPNSFDVPSTSAMIDFTEAVALEEAPTVPDIHMEEDQTFNAPPIFFPENNYLTSANLQFGCNANSTGIPQESQANTDTENLDHTLPPEELSMDLNCPEDYDPASEIIQSLGKDQNARDDPFMNATSFDFTEVEPHDIQFDLPIEAESIIWSNNHPMVTEKENQEPKSPELLKGSRT